MEAKTKDKREEMKRESWLKNVLRIYPNKTREEAEELYSKLFQVDITKQK